MQEGSRDRVALHFAREDHALGAVDVEADERVAADFAEDIAEVARVELDARRGNVVTVDDAGDLAAAAKRLDTAADRAAALRCDFKFLCHGSSPECEWSTTRSHMKILRIEGRHVRLRVVTE